MIEFEQEVPQDTATLEVLDSRKRIVDILLEAGLDIEEIAPRIVDRLELLNSKTKTVEDGKHALDLARAIFDYVDKVKQSDRWSELERKIVLVGSIFSDIGKTGPGNASPQEQDLITTMFGIEDVIDPKMPVEVFFQTYFQDTSADKLSTFRNMQLDPNMTMREFWNLHSLWTLQIISGDGVPLEAIAGAAIHHILEGVNPNGILGTDEKFDKYYGENLSFDRPEKLIIILDKFDAYCRRGGKTPTEAIQSLREMLATKNLFKDDNEFKTLIDDLEQAILS